MNDLFGPEHEAEESDLYGAEHERQWRALVEFRRHLEEEDPAIQQINRTDPFVVSSIFSAGYRAGQARSSSAIEEGLSNDNG